MAESGNQKFFHRLIKLQRGKEVSTQALDIDGLLTFDPDLQRAGWAEYYQEPMAAEDQSKSDFLCLIREMSQHTERIEPFSPSQV